MTRRICYVSGTRADFGLMQSTLLAVAAHPELNLDLLVTGMHLSHAHGYTVSEIRETGLTIRAEIPLELEPATGLTMARNIGFMVTRFADLLAKSPPDLVLLLGDRGEMLAGAIAAIHLNLPVCHIHGGERSGTVDEPVRHAISKLSHCHLVATNESRERLIRMGERPDCIFVTGAPGLDGLEEMASIPRQTLCRDLGWNSERPIALLVFHPVLQETEIIGAAIRQIFDYLGRCEVQVLALMPNSDAGSQVIRDELSRRMIDPTVRVVSHLTRQKFVSWMAVCDLMIGNSSAGIIEAATFGTPVLNIGSRQNLRERNANVCDVSLEPDALGMAIASALDAGRKPCHNRYGDGSAGSRIVERLVNLELTQDLTGKSNVY